MVQIQTDLDTLYPAHLAHVKKLYDTASRAAGKDGVLIASGALKSTFLDDHTYPFKVNPHFKAWLPVTDVNDSFILFRGDEKPQL